MESTLSATNNAGIVLKKIIRRIFMWLIGIVLTGVVGFFLWTWASLKYVYSSGERAGYVQKISKRGWLFKTWEGELAMVNLPGAMTEKFLFTVRDEMVAHQIEQSLGQRVALTYHQHRGVPSTIFGETSYFIVHVRPVDSTPQTDSPSESTASPSPSSL